MTRDPLTVRNCEPVPLDAIPLLDTNDFLSMVTEWFDAGGHAAAYFGYRINDSTRLFAAITHHASGSLALASCRAESEMPSLASDFPRIQLFEREIAEQFGVSFIGHPWFKPVRFCGPFDGANDVFGGPPAGAANFFAMEGDEIHEVAVGPVHAGVIEPGHFRFQCHGENVYHLEISLGYQHRGIEERLIGGPGADTRYLMESCAGDTTSGHTLAYCQLMESLASCDVPPRAHALRAIALELERCANHIGDIGALAGDVGYLPTASFCGRIRGDVLNITARLCGNRFGRSFIREGGVGFDVEEGRADRILTDIASARKDFKNAADLLWDAPSVLSRFENTGTVSKSDCERLGIVGPAARASGVSRDARQDFPSGYYQFSQIPVVTHEGGDVYARASVRYGEVLKSFDFIEEQCRQLPDGAIEATKDSCRKNHAAVSLTEGWRGQICHVAITDESGRFARYKIVDPSFHNWSALAMALRGQQISDFPLCNKSFNLSYCGYDL